MALTSCCMGEGARARKAVRASADCGNEYSEAMLLDITGGRTGAMRGADVTFDCCIFSASRAVYCTCVTMKALEGTDAPLQAYTEVAMAIKIACSRVLVGSDLRRHTSASVMTWFCRGR